MPSLFIITYDPRQQYLLTCHQAKIVALPFHAEIYVVPPQSTPHLRTPYNNSVLLDSIITLIL